MGYNKPRKQLLVPPPPPTAPSMVVAQTYTPDGVPPGVPQGDGNPYSEFFAQKQQVQAAPSDNPYSEFFKPVASNPPVAPQAVPAAPVASPMPQPAAAVAQHPAIGAVVVHPVAMPVPIKPATKKQPVPPRKAQQPGLGELALQGIGQQVAGLQQLGLNVGSDVGRLVQHPGQIGNAIVATAAGVPAGLAQFGQDLYNAGVGGLRSIGIRGAQPADFADNVQEAYAPALKAFPGLSGIGQFVGGSLPFMLPIAGEAAGAGATLAKTALKGAAYGAAAGAVQDAGQQVSTGRYKPDALTAAVRGGTGGAVIGAALGTGLHVAGGALKGLSKQPQGVSAPVTAPQVAMPDGSVVDHATALKHLDAAQKLEAAGKVPPVSSERIADAIVNAQERQIQGQPPAQARGANLATKAQELARLVANPVTWQDHLTAVKYATPERLDDVLRSANDLISEQMKGLPDIPYKGQRKAALLNDLNQALTSRTAGLKAPDYTRNLSAEDRNAEPATAMTVDEAMQALHREYPPQAKPGIERLHQALAELEAQHPTPDRVALAQQVWQQLHEQYGPTEQQRLGDVVNQMVEQFQPSKAERAQQAWNELVQQYGDAGQVAPEVAKTLADFRPAGVESQEPLPDLTPLQRMVETPEYAQLSNQHMQNLQALDAQRAQLGEAKYNGQRNAVQRAYEAKLNDLLANMDSQTTAEVPQNKPELVGQNSSTPAAPGRPPAGAAVGPEAASPATLSESQDMVPQTSENAISKNATPQSAEIKPGTARYVGRKDGATFVIEDTHTGETVRTKDRKAFERSLADYQSGKRTMGQGKRSDLAVPASKDVQLPGDATSYQTKVIQSGSPLPADAPQAIKKALAEIEAAARKRKDALAQREGAVSAAHELAGAERDITAGRGYSPQREKAVRAALLSDPFNPDNHSIEINLDSSPLPDTSPFKDMDKQALNAKASQLFAEHEQARRQYEAVREKHLPVILEYMRSAKLPSINYTTPRGSMNIRATAKGELLTQLAKLPEQAAADTDARSKQATLKQLGRLLGDERR